MNHDDEGTRRDAVDVSYGGLNLAARGSIVVLVILIAGQSIFTLMTYSWLNNKIDDVVAPQNLLLDKIIETQHKHRGEQGSEARTMVDAVVRNRDYLREIGRTCLFTEVQKIKFQQQLTPAMRELLQQEYLK